MDKLMDDQINTNMQADGDEEDNSSGDSED